MRRCCRTRGCSWPCVKICARNCKMQSPGSGVPPSSGSRQVRWRRGTGWGLLLQQHVGGHPSLSWLCRQGCCVFLSCTSDAHCMPETAAAPSPAAALASPPTDTRACCVSCLCLPACHALPPTAAGQDLDLQRLYRCTTELGGAVAVTEQQRWPVSVSAPVWTVSAGVLDAARTPGGSSYTQQQLLQPLQPAATGAAT